MDLESKEGQEIVDMVLTHSGKEVSSIEAFTSSLSGSNGVTEWFDNQGLGTTTSLKSYYLGTVTFSGDITYNDGGTSLVVSLQAYIETRSNMSLILDLEPVSTATVGLSQYNDSFHNLFFTYLSLKGQSGVSKNAYMSFVGYKITVKG